MVSCEAHKGRLRSDYSDMLGHGADGDAMYEYE